MKTDEFRRKPMTTGTWISSGSPVIAEMAARYPFDWLLLDFEHGGAPEAALPDLLRATTHQRPAIVVRVPALDPILISRALDWGADGIMIPHVHSAKEAVLCVAATRYPPHGSRGYSSSVRTYGYGINPPADPSLVQPLVFAQIEDEEGVRNSYAVAAVSGIDVLFVGPADLRLALAGNQATNTMTFEAAIRQVANAAVTHRKQAGILIRDYNQIGTLKKAGFSCLAIDSDIGILRAGYKRLTE